MSIWKALFGKPQQRKSNTSYPGEPPAGYTSRLVARNRDAVDRDCGNAEKLEINPECEDAYNLDWEKFDQWYNEKIDLLKSQGRSFFVISSFNGHDEGADVYYRICESREQMESIRRSYDDMADSYIAHELVLNVVDGKEVDDPPEWWTDYENSFQETQWQSTGSSKYRL